MKEHVAKIKYPKGEEVMTAYNRDGNTIYIMTRKDNTVDSFCLYAVNKDGTIEKKRKGKNPIELETDEGIFPNNGIENRRKK